MRTGFKFYYFDHNVNTGWTGKERLVSNNRRWNTDDESATDTIITSGPLNLSYNTGRDSGGYGVLLGYVSVNTIDFTIYKKLIIGVAYYDRDFSYTLCPALRLSFINTSKNGGYYLSASPDSDTVNTNLSGLSASFSGEWNNTSGYYTIDVTNLTGSYYLVLLGRAYFNSTNDNHQRKYEGAFTKIEFKTS